MKKAVFAKNVFDFYRSLHPDLRLPKGFSIMNPFTEPETLELVRLFYQKYFNDTDKRYFIFGINPGRLGGGMTGIPFTDPVHLKSNCGIDNQLQPKKELSSEFIYKMITAFGGPEKFYRKFFLTAVCPLGFMQDEKNANYYDSGMLLKSTWDFIRTTMLEQVNIGSFKETCFCLGQGKNLQYLEQLNNESGLFKKIVPLPHPRWIMQYRRKSVAQYIDEYINAFSKV